MTVYRGRKKVDDDVIYAEDDPSEEEYDNMMMESSKVELWISRLHVCEHAQGPSETFLWPLVYICIYEVYCCVCLVKFGSCAHRLLCDL